MHLVTLFSEQPVFFAVVAGLLGLLVGSFLNVVIYRLPIMMEREDRALCAELLNQTGEAQAVFNLWTPRSRCPGCKHLIGSLENIPVISYILQRGRCKHCGIAISPQYPLIEAATALLSAIVAWQFGWGWQAGVALLLTWCLIVLSGIDFKHMILPDKITLPLIWLGLLLALFSLFTDLRSSVIGAMAGYLSLWSIYHLFRLLTGKEGMGYGDFKLLAALGAWQGWQMLLPIILLSSLVGALIGIAMMLLLGRDHRIPM
ncbi:MAG: prepilin peptidase, partial [Candidatus Competibacteraceae bacterium]|nr:prepilin peptidase [Candidatus Competibacteraceae bacterium]